MRPSFPISISIGFFIGVLCFSAEIFGQTRVEKEREKASLRQQFTRSFRDLQISSQQMLNSHRAETLTTSQLAKLAKAVHKSAKALQSLMVLGELVEEESFPTSELINADGFDQTINNLAESVYLFSHSPHHKNHRVFDMAEASKVQKTLLKIIHLSKLLDRQSKRYIKAAISK